MKRILIATLAMLGLNAAGASSLAAQDYRSSVGWNAGAMLTTSLNDGASDGENVVDLKPDVTWSLGGHFDRWFGSGLLGARASVGFSRHIVPWTQGDRSVYSYRGDLSLLLRLIRPNPSNTMIPFVSGGIGAIRWGLGDGPVTTFSAAGARYSGDEGFQPAGIAGVGFDYITPFNWGEGPMIVRLEGKDHIQFASPFDPANPDSGDFSLVHNIFISLGVHTGVDVLGGGY